MKNNFDELFIVDGERKKEYWTINFLDGPPPYTYQAIPHTLLVTQGLMDKIDELVKMNETLYIVNGVAVELIK